MLAERCVEHSKQLHVCIIVYEKVFGGVDCSILMVAPKKIGVEWKDRRRIKNLYTK